MSAKNNIVIFDFDGVLVNTLDVCFEINRKFSHGLSLEAFLSRFDGNVYEALEKEGIGKPSTQKEFFDLYTPKILECPIVPGVLELCRALSETYTMLIVSSSTHEAVRTYLEANNIFKYFHGVFGIETSRSKVEKFSMIFDTYTVAASDCVFVTDTLGDIREATEIRIPSIGVTWGFHEQERLEKGTPRKVVSSVDSLHQEIDSYFKEVPLTQQ